MVRPLTAYLAQDRLRAVARGEILPDRATGSALFADISGFTALTEQLTETLGERRGVEELTRRVNAIYDAFIGEVERHGGSMVSFAGGAITYWFDQAGLKEESSSLVASRCALAMQAAKSVSIRLLLTYAAARGDLRTHPRNGASRAGRPGV